MEMNRCARWGIGALTIAAAGCLYPSASPSTPPAAAPVAGGGAIPESLAAAEGYRLEPAAGRDSARPPEDHAAPLFYAVIPPPGKRAVVGRVLASCSCLLAEAVPGGEDGQALIRVRRRHPPPAVGDGFLLMVWLTEPDGLLLQRIIPR